MSPAFIQKGIQVYFKNISWDEILSPICLGLYNIKAYVVYITYIHTYIRIN